MKKYLFKAGKNIYKTNLHCHTTVSDGHRTPQEIKDMYKAAGYSVVAFTDHDKLVNHSYLNDDSFLAVSGCELGLNQVIPGVPFKKTKLYHFNLYATNPSMETTPPPLKMDYSDKDAINRYISDRVSEGFLVCYNHPYWSTNIYEDYAPLRGCFAMEIYNHNCELGDGYYGYNPQVYDEMLRTGNNIFCVATDDNHNWQHDSFGGFVMVNADSLSYGNIINGLKQGDFYASQGPEIYEIAIEGKKLTVKCSEVDIIVVYTDGRKSHYARAEGMEGAEFELDGDEKYIRVMCRDRHKKDACSIAYWGVV